ncbi:capping complex subunit for YIEGIA [Caldibacillus debilis]|uniref:Uncharacterized protein n=1 Tax=Caldibacillus debilis GB1 TaxID=1339248 RepID=A0A420VEZ9_9BACI|nr:hypothetical protein [Caldibacillus debilis]RKO62125.1 hypothetical protein Cdeb_00859 [Caldibacillus debilis GB1]
MGTTFEKNDLGRGDHNPKKAPSGICVFHCDDEEEMFDIAAKLEAITDGIAHRLRNDLMILVRHG